MCTPLTAFPSISTVLPYPPHLLPSLLFNSRWPFFSPALSFIATFEHHPPAHFPGEVARCASLRLGTRRYFSSIHFDTRRLLRYPTPARHLRERLHPRRRLLHEHALYLARIRTTGRVVLDRRTGRKGCEPSDRVEVVDHSHRQLQGLAGTLFAILPSFSAKLTHSTPS
jgi:hypothetical protein